jgi:hypothetical protein
MAMKVNYGFQKSERDRAKQAKKDAKVREKANAAKTDASAEPKPAEAGEPPKSE